MYMFVLQLVLDSNRIFAEQYPQFCYLIFQCLPAMYKEDGSSLPLGEQLYRRK